MILTKVFPVSYPNVHKYGREEEVTNPDLVIGLELEIENLDGRSNTAWVNLADKHQYNVDRDGSLRGNAFEFISRPMYMKNAVAATLDFWKEAKFTEENYSDRCSIHVHVNCTDLEMEHISNVALLYTVAEEILFEFVGQHRDSNIYCIPWNQCRAHLDLIQGFLSRPDTTLKRWNKYTAVNLLPLTSLGTIEFRQLHGTANPDKFKQWLNIIGAIFKMAKEVPMKDLIEDIKTLNTTSEYERFFIRMLGGQLPYNSTYQQKMEEGVIFAKYSLINLSKSKKRGDVVEEEVIRPVAVPIARTTTARANRPVGERIAAVMRGENEPGLVGGWNTAALRPAQLDNPAINIMLQEQVARHHAQMARGRVRVELGQQAFAGVLPPAPPANPLRWDMGFDEETN